MIIMLNSSTVKIATTALLLGLGSVLFAQDTAVQAAQDEAMENSAESVLQEDKAYTSYAICAGFYTVMADEFRTLPPAPEVNDTIEAYQEAGEISTRLATVFASIDYSAEAIDTLVSEAITRETDTMKLMMEKDMQLVGSLYDMICEQMINEAFTVLAG